MHQNELNRAVAQATGESVATIQRRGFSPLRLDDESQESPDGPEPQTVDWDALDARRHLANQKSINDVLVPV